MIHNGVVDEGFNEVKDDIAFSFATSNWYLCIVASRAKQSTDAGVGRQ